VKLRRWVREIRPSTLISHQKREIGKTNRQVEGDDFLGEHPREQTQGDRRVAWKKKGK